MELCRRVRRGDRTAAAELIARHDGLVWSNAWRIHGALLPLGYDLEDTAQLGREGVLRAARKYDGSHAFTTYAVHWVRSCMLRPLQEGMTTARLRNGQAAMARGETVNPALADEVRARKAARRPTTSLQRPMLRDADESSADTLADAIPSGAEPADEVLARAELCERARREVAGLKDRRLREVLERRFGLLGGEEWTLKDIGEKFGVSHERARQLEVRALGLLRARMEDAR